MEFFLQGASFLDMILMGVGVLFMPRGFILGRALYISLHSRAQLHRKEGIDLLAGKLVWGLMGAGAGWAFPLFVSFFVRDLFKSL